MCRCGIAGWFWVSCLNSVKVIFSATPPQKRLLGQKRLLAASYFVVCCPPKGKQNKAKERLDAYTSRESQECALANGTDVTAPSVEAMPKRANPPPLTRSLVQVLKNLLCRGRGECRCCILFVLGADGAKNQTQKQGGTCCLSNSYISTKVVHLFAEVKERSEIQTQSAAAVS